jgi:hypothetical protein
LTDQLFALSDLVEPLPEGVEKVAAVAWKTLPRPTPVDGAMPPKVVEVPLHDGDGLCREGQGGQHRGGQDGLDHVGP